MNTISEIRIRVLPPYVQGVHDTSEIAIDVFTNGEDIGYRKIIDNRVLHTQSIFDMIFEYAKRDIAKRLGIPTLEEATKRETPITKGESLKT